MSRMHSDGRGSSGSSPPAEKKVMDWTDYSSDEVRDKVVQMAEDGLEPSEIGAKLRDQHGIYDVKTITGEKITEILRDEGLDGELPEDLDSLVEKARNLEEHVDENPADGDAERRLELAKAKVRRVADYYRGKGRIPSDWKYED